MANKFTDPLRGLGHDLNNFYQHVVSTCHLVKNDVPDELREKVMNLLKVCRETANKSTRIIEEHAPMKVPPLRVFVVEDDPAIRYFLKESMLELGHTVVGEAGDGPGMVRGVLDLQPSLVVFDIHLPGMDGLHAFAEISRVYSVPGVAVTGDTTPISA